MDDDGTVTIASHDGAGAEEAKRRVEAMCAEIKVGAIYDGKVASIKEFGAFIEIAPGRDGLCHISELDAGYVNHPLDVVNVGDKVTVKVIAIDDQGRIKLSRKALMPPREGGDEGAGLGLVGSQSWMAGTLDLFGLKTLSLSGLLGILFRRIFLLRTELGEPAYERSLKALLVALGASALDEAERRARILEGRTGPRPSDVRVSSTAARRQPEPLDVDGKH